MDAFLIPAKSIGWVDAGPGCTEDDLAARYYGPSFVLHCLSFLVLVV